MMKRTIVLHFLILSLGVGHAVAEIGTGDLAGEPNRRTRVVARITGCDISQDHLDLQYEIRNDSSVEVWICDDIDVDSPVECEMVTNVDGSVLYIRLRLGMPMGWWRLVPPTARYVRVMPGECYVTSILLRLPLREQPVLAGRSAHHVERQVCARRLVLEIGYFSGGLATRIDALVRDVNATERLWRVEEDEFDREMRELREGRRRMSQQKNEVTERDERLRLEDEIRKLDREYEGLVDRYKSLNRWSFYSESLHTEIPMELARLLADKVSNTGTTGKGKLVIPYWYVGDVDRESFLRLSVDDISVPCLPPRYLDLTQEVPWKKQPGRVQGAAH